jgi:hypothetical protein
MDFGPLMEEFRARGCVGLGEFLPKMDFDDPLAMNLYKQAGQHNLPIIFDMADRKWGYGVNDDYGLPRLEHALKECPETIFVGHGPTFWAEISAEVPEDGRATYVEGPVLEGGAVPRLMREYENLWADTSANSGCNGLSRDPEFGIAFLDEFQDKIMFGTDSCRRSDVHEPVPIVTFFHGLQEEKKLSDEAWEKIAWKNAVRLLGI